MGCDTINNNPITHLKIEVGGPGPGIPEPGAREGRPHKQQSNHSLLSILKL